MPARSHVALALALLTLAGALAGCLDDDAASGVPGASSDPAGPVLASNLHERVPADAHRFTGSVQRSEIGYGATDFTFDVPAGAIGVHALLKADADAPLELRLLAPSGAIVTGARELPGETAAATTTPPEAGTWTVRVTSPERTERDFTATVWVVGDVNESRVDERVRLRPGGFVEANVLLRANDTLEWAFDSNVAIEFDVHSHSGRNVVKHAEGAALKKSGAFTAPADGTYSFFATPQDAVALVDYALRGPFRVLSRVVT